MITEKEKQLLKSSLDLAINETTQSLVSTKDEMQRDLKRGLVFELLALTQKVNNFEIKKQKSNGKD